LGMDNVAVHLPRQLVEQVDALAADELRSRANTVRWLVDEALRRHESGAAEDGESR
jgi:metal-responsive CopG/Arc/MetJ family transcriptional regulator